jgi:type VI protein secretion system component Hcp
MRKLLPPLLALALCGAIADTQADMLCYTSEIANGQAVAFSQSTTMPTTVSMGAASVPRANFQDLSITLRPGDPAAVKFLSYALPGRVMREFALDLRPGGCGSAQSTYRIHMTNVFITGVAQSVAAEGALLTQITMNAAQIDWTAAGGTPQQSRFGWNQETRKSY